MMRNHQHGLLSEIAGPVGFDSERILVFGLSLFVCVNVVSLTSLQSCVPVALNLKVGVGYQYRIVWRI